MVIILVAITATARFKLSILVAPHVRIASARPICRSTIVIIALEPAPLLLSAVSGKLAALIPLLHLRGPLATARSTALRSALLTAATAIIVVPATIFTASAAAPGELSISIAFLHFGGMLTAARTAFLLRL